MSKNILEEMYQMRQYQIEEERQKRKPQPIYFNDMVEELREACSNKETADKIKKEMEMLIEIYQDQMTQSTEIYYKQGFKDGVNLFFECKKN